MSTPSCKWTEWFVCDPTSPSGLRWRDGKPAGYRDRQGYWAVAVIPDEDDERLQPKVHRIIWEICVGPIVHQIDHKDGDKGNNALDNLRDVPQKINMRNRASSSQKKLDVPNGVFRNTKTNKYGTEYVYWIAGWYDDESKYHYKRFSSLKLGDEVAKQCAIELRKEKDLELKEIHYTSRHGSRQ